MQEPQEPTSRLVLIAHGSRRESANEEVRALTARLATRLGAAFADVRCAFLELAQPDIPTALAAAAAAGPGRVVVLPYFLVRGRHLEVDVTGAVEAMRAAHPAVQFDLTGCAGEAPAMVDLLADLATAGPPPAAVIDAAALESVLSAIDDANAADPRLDPDPTQGGALRPREWLHGRRMMQRLAMFLPTASPALRIAARAHHLERWRIPRESRPAGRPGYHAWRRELQELHAARAGELMREAGLDDATIARVQALLRKEGLKRDAEAQALEDVACLVFLEHEALAFAQRFIGERDEEAFLTIIRRTWPKMSAAGQRAALALTLPADVAALVRRALQPAV